MMLDMAANGSEFVKLQQLKTAIDSKRPDMTSVDFVGDRYDKGYDMVDYALMVLVVASNESYDPIGTAVVPMQLLDEVGQLTFAGDGYSPVRVSGGGGMVTVSDMDGGAVFKLYGVR